MTQALGESRLGTGSRFTDADLDRFVDDLNRDGAVLIPGLFPTELVDEWARAFQALFEERRRRPGGLAPREKNRYYLTLPWVPPFANQDVFANPVILGVLDRLFPQEYVMVQLGADVPLQGSEFQTMHRDYRTLFTDDFNTPLYAVAVNFPLVDVTEDNGPFHMARGTHVIPREEGLRKVESGEIPIESVHAKRGDVMIRTPLQLHRGTPNKTEQPRPMVVMGYTLHWLHTANVDLTIPRAYYESLPENIQKMLRCKVVDELPREATETYLDFKF